MKSEAPCEEVGHLLRAVGAEVRVIRDVERRVAMLAAPRFALFDFFRTDEMGLSSCIAALLDPSGTHGQGSAYLELFMDLLDCGRDWRENLEKATVATEARSSGRRRHDIEVELAGRRAIVIENKPWAADQPLQLSAYAQALRERCCEGGWKLVYLSHSPPSESSISKGDLSRYESDRSLQVMGFHELVLWLGKCAQRTRPQAVRIFIEHLEQYVRSTLLGEAGMSETESIKEVVLASPENLRSALLVGSTLDSVKRQLLTKGLKEPLGEAIGPGFYWEEAVLTGRGQAGFGVRHTPDAAGHLRFQFEQPGWSDFFWGIRRSDLLASDVETRPEAQALRELLDAEFGSGERGKAWFWYSTRLAPLCSPGQRRLPQHWRSDEETWLAMQCRGLHEGIAAHARRVVELIGSSSAHSILATPR